jgi:peroxiredoxin
MKDVGRFRFTMTYDIAEQPDGDAFADDVFTYSPAAGVTMRDLSELGGEQPVSLEGQNAPDFALPDLEGKEVRLSSFRGKPVILDFWASWCIPCQGSMPKLQAFSRKYARDGLIVIGVSLDDDIAAARKFVSDNGISFTIVSGTDDQGSLARVTGPYAVQGIPRTLFIDPEGVIRADLSGLSEDGAYIEALKSIGLGR